MALKKITGKKLEYIEDAEERLDMETKVATDFINKLAGTYDGDVSFEFFDAIDGEEEENFAGDEETPIDVICFVADNFGGIGDLYVNVDMIDGEVDGIFVHGQSFEDNEWADGYTISNFRGDPGFFNVILHGLLGDEDSADESRSKKKESKKHTCSMQKKKESLNTKAESEDATSFEVKDDGIYVNGECITLNADDWYADKRETKTLSDVIPEMVGSRKVFVIDPQYDYYIVKTLYTGKDIKPVKKVKVYKDFELYDTADVVSACVGDYVRDIGPIVSESKKHTCSMQKKKESVSKKNESSLSHFVVSNAETALDTVCDEILSHTNDDFVINDADAAEIVGKYAIMRELDGFGGYSGTADEFAEWVDGVLSGSPLDGSPFGSAEATEYARKIWSEED